LVRDAVYQSLNSGWQQDLHYKVGLALENSAGDQSEISGVLAHHFCKSADINKAIYYSKLAATHARQLFALREAITYFLQILNIVSSTKNLLTETEILVIKCQLGDSYELIGEYDEAINIYLEAMTNIDFVNASGRLVGSQLARVYDRKGQYEQALNIYKAIGEQVFGLEEYQSKLGVIKNARGMASVYWHREQSHQALAFCRHALAIIGDEDATHPTLKLDHQTADEQVGIYEIMANSYFHLGNYEESVNHYQTALKISETLDRRPMTARLLIGLGRVAHRRGQYSLAAGYGEKSLQICVAIGHVSGEAAANGLQGDVAYNRGNLILAIKFYEKALSIYSQIGDKHGIADSFLSLGFTKIDQNEIDIAENYLLKALTLGYELDSALVLIRAQYNLVRVAFARGQLDLAQVGAEKALKAAQIAGIRLLEAAGNHQLGVILFYRQDLTQGEFHILKALQQYESLGDIYETAWVLRSLAELLAIRGEISQALPHLYSSINLFSEMGAERELIRTKEVLEHLKTH
jgi:tetratricopeptide (TPR) repeat protein